MPASKKCTKPDEQNAATPTPIPSPGARCSCGRELKFWAVRGGGFVCAHCSGSLGGER